MTKTFAPTHRIEFADTATAPIEVEALGCSEGMELWMEGETTKEGKPGSRWFMTNAGSLLSRFDRFGDLKPWRGVRVVTL